MSIEEAHRSDAAGTSSRDPAESAAEMESHGEPAAGYKALDNLDPALFPEGRLDEEMLRVLFRALQDATEDLADNELFRKIVNHTPVLGEVLLAKGAITGQEGKRALPTNERIIYAIIALAASYALFMVSRGQFRRAATAQGISEVLQEADLARSFLRQAASKLQTNRPELAEILTSLSDWEDWGQKIADFAGKIDKSYLVVNAGLEEAPYRD